MKTDMNTSRILLLSKKQIKMLDNVIHYMYESEGQNFDEHIANGGDKKNHILNDVMELEKYADSKLGERWNKN